MSMDHSHITVRKHSFLSSAAFGLSAIVITVVVSLTVLVLYGVHLASEKSDQVISLAQGAIHGLPQFRRALLPALSDMLDAADHDRRGPIMPGSRRRFLCSGGHLYDVGPLDEIKAEIEITELRVWNGPETQPGLPGEPAVSVSARALPSEGR